MCIIVQEKKLSTISLIRNSFAGWYFATSAFTVLMRIMGKGSYHDTDKNGQTRKHYKYYFADGNFGVFNCRKLFEEMDPKPVKVVLKCKRSMQNLILTLIAILISYVLIQSIKNTLLLYPSTFYGPVLTDLDTICKLELPELQCGEWFYYENSGAYSLNFHSEFNGFSKPEMCYMIEESDK